MPFSFNFRASETQQITCYHCGQVQEVGRRALTVTCQKCHKPLQIGDLKVKAYDARRKVQTTGSLVGREEGPDRQRRGGVRHGDYSRDH